MIDIKQKIFRYLYNNLKPSDIEKKEEIIKKLFAKTGNQIIVEQNFDNKNHKIITFDFNGKKTSIKLSDIIYLESFLHEITIHTSFDDYKYSSSFNKMMLFINSTNIVRIHKSYVVNLFWVKEIYKEEMILNNGITLKIGKKYRQDVLKKYKEYLLK